MEFDAYTEGLVRGCHATDGVLGLLLVGSTSATRREWRDEWSDHDFYAVLAHPDAEQLRRSLDFLPARERIVLAAREGPFGLSVLYDDGHLFEFAAGSPAELGDIRIGTYEVAYDRGPVAPLVAAATAPRPKDPVTAGDDAGLALVKLLVGVGRVRRGEALSGGFFVRSYAVSHLVRAVRARLRPAGEPVGDALDPLRRFERDYPEMGARLAAALGRPVEDAARSIFELLRAALEPGWVDFPSAAADVVAARLGWA